MVEEYIIINKTAIQKRIEELEKDVKFYSNEDKKLEANQCLGAADSLKQILSQSTPLIPEIEKAFDAGHRICKGGFMYIPSKRDYISNLKLDI